MAAGANATRRTEKEVFKPWPLAPSRGRLKPDRTAKSRREQRTPKQEGSSPSNAKETSREGYHQTSEATDERQPAHETTQATQELEPGDVGGEGKGPLISRARFVGKDVQWLACGLQTCEAGKAGTR